MKNQTTKADLNHSRLCTDQVVAEVMKAAEQKIKPDDFDTALVKKINAMCTKCFEHFKRMHDIQHVPMSKLDAIEHIRRLYREELKTWSKNELLEGFALIQASLGAESFHNELI